jgi:hypothetical protein
VNTPGPSDDELLPLPIPSLVATLLKAEQDKGSPLTRVEVEVIRDNCPCVMSPRWMIAKLAEGRGYDDVDPEHVWEQWLEVRPTLVDYLPSDRTE